MHIFVFGTGRWTLPEVFMKESQSENRQEVVSLCMELVSKPSVTPEFDT